MGLKKYFVSSYFGPEATKKGAMLGIPNNGKRDKAVIMGQAMRNEKLLHENSIK